MTVIQYYVQQSIKFTPVCAHSMLALSRKSSFNLFDIWEKIQQNPQFSYCN